MFLKYIKRACRDTRHSLDIKETMFYAALIILISIPFGGKEWTFSSIVDMDIAIAALLVLIAVYFANLILAPYRICKEENESLRKAIEKYESSAVKDLVTINGNEHEGVWYGNKFVLDNPLQIVSHQSNDVDFSTIFKVPCPQNSLVELRYKLRYPLITGKAAFGMVGHANLALGRPGTNGKPTLTGTGKETVRVDKHCLVEALVENGMGFDMVVDIDLISWEQHGDR